MNSYATACFTVIFVGFTILFTSDLSVNTDKVQNTQQCFTSHYGWRNLVPLDSTFKYYLMEGKTYKLERARSEHTIYRYLNTDDLIINLKDSLNLEGTGVRMKTTSREYSQQYLYYKNQVFTRDITDTVAPVLKEIPQFDPVGPALQGIHMYISKNKRYIIYTSEEVPKSIHPLVYNKLDLNGGVVKFIDRYSLYEKYLIGYETCSKDMEQLSDSALSSFKNIRPNSENLKKMGCYAFNFPY